LLENTALHPCNQHFFEEEDGGGRLERNDYNRFFNSFGVPTSFKKESRPKTW
jgi:hypothetical protein